MRILFTGASSFTGYWFVRELASAGHEVVATFQGERDSYQGVRAERVLGLESHCRPVYGCSFGSAAFFEVIAGERNWDLLCHHAADVTDYKSADFDYATALQRNTWKAAGVLDQLRSRGCGRLVLTGSVFEGGEGAGSDGLPAFSPYGLSKELTAKAFNYFAQRTGFHLGKFVIPNPFGPLEEPRFTAYLIKTWAKGETASVNTPAYVRDNIHVSLLAKAYASFAARLPAMPGRSQTNPSGYVESQGQFAQRFADQMAPRLGLECRLTFAEQNTFDEPRMRVNTDPVDGDLHLWSDQDAWDELARYYADQIAVVTSGEASHG